MAGRDNIIEDGKYYEAQLGGKPGFLICYEVIDLDDTDGGEFSDNGYDGYHSCEPDEYDIEEGKTAGDLAVEYLNSKCLEFSGRWWTDADGDTDWGSGEETRHSYHPYNWTDEQMREIVRRVKG
jgi:hypothetical protein